MRRSRTILLLLVFVGFLTSCSSTRNLKSKRNSLVELVKKKYAPDSRVAIFKIKAVKKGETIKYVGETNLGEAKDELLELSKNKYRIIVDSIKMLPDAMLEDEIRAVVRLSVCNIRSKPKHSAELSTQAILGTPVKIYKKENGWYYIQTPDGYLGWVDKGGINVMNKYEQENWISSHKVVFTDVYGFVYSKPNIKSKVVSDIVEGGILKLVGESLDKKYWVVSFSDSRVVYITKKSSMKLVDFVKKADNADSNDILNSAYQLMGIPYLWGGTSAKAMDCSGFTKTVYFMNGIQLARDASQQVKYGKKIRIDKKFSKLKPADLLFFGTNRKDGSERITHVAIYLGNGKIIHETGEVKIQSIKRGDKDFVEYRLNSLKQVRRIIGNVDKFGIKSLKSVNSYLSK
jgi:cell wall-associated NlpC family hydrolase